jgi:superfamily I DNA/RNA helicase
MQLNAEQQAVVNSIEGAFVVISGPGSGKTACMVERFLAMVTRGIPVSDILNLTFTNSAAKEAAERVGLLNAEAVFRTFHSFALELIKREREHLPFKLGETVIPVKGEDYLLLFDLVKAYPAISSFRVLQGKLSEWKRSNIEPEQAIAEAIGREYYLGCAYREYEDRCRADGWLDFDSLIFETVKLLETNEEVRNRWKKRYIAVDEFQDTDTRQLRMLELLFDGNLMCVGDTNQGIYTWRGAHPDVFKHIQQKFPNVKTLYLGQNYRSSQKIVSFVKEITPEDNGISSRMMTTNEAGIDPAITRYQDDQEEAVQTLLQITDPVNTVIMARTNRQLFVFQRLCVSRGIKYRILGKKDFFETSEVKKLLQLAKESKDMRSADQVLSSLIYEHNLLNIYRGSGDPMESDPAENLNSVVRMAQGKGTVPEFLERLRKLTYARKSAKGLTLSTVHQMKGKQADHVFVVGVDQNRMPHRDGEIGEEKRIWFTACSRAAKTLNISFYGPRSEFLNDYIDKIEDYEPELGERND